MTTTWMFPMIPGNLDLKLLVKDDVAGDLWHDAFFGTPEVPPATTDGIGCHAGM